MEIFIKRHRIEEKWKYEKERERERNRERDLYFKDEINGKVLILYIKWNII
jgi:hypothetical protein